MPKFYSNAFNGGTRTNANNKNVNKQTRTQARKNYNNELYLTYIANKCASYRWHANADNVQLQHTQSCQVSPANMMHRKQTSTTLSTNYSTKDLSKLGGSAIGKGGKQAGNGSHNCVHVSNTSVAAPTLPAKLSRQIQQGS